MNAIDWLDDRAHAIYDAHPLGIQIVLYLALVTALVLIFGR
jgi:hypothetical protein